MEMVLENQRKHLLEEAAKAKLWAERPRWKKLLHWCQHQLFRLKLRKTTPYEQKFDLRIVLPMIKRIMPGTIK